MEWGVLSPILFIIHINLSWMPYKSMVLVATGSITLLVLCVTQMMLLFLLHPHQPSESCSVYVSKFADLHCLAQLIKFSSSTASLNIAFFWVTNNSISHPISLMMTSVTFLKMCVARPTIFFMFSPVEPDPFHVLYGAALWRLLNSAEAFNN